MRAETWARVSVLFQEALDAAPGERDALISRTASDSPEVRAEVERLLRLDGASGESFDSRRILLASAWSPGPGARIGRYTIVRVIAAGGMGTVFEARQEQPQRTVALKTLRMGLITPERKQRFQFEVEALARLQHPGIAQIHESGMHREGELELPFFAMELVEGARDILTYAREERLSQAAVIDLFIAVCDAVHHGHQRGLIHRDLKPSNVLVNSSGQPKVIDFGVARLPRESDEQQKQLTHTGQIVGTLNYMSPEQIAGRAAEIAVQSDVYALGTILHELLTGRLPHDLRDLPLAEAVRIVCETEPVRPSGIEPEIGWIILKCLERDPSRRYSSASELKSDLERFVSDEPVVAGPPGRTYRLRKFLQRHRVSLLALAAVVAALAVGFVRAQSAAHAARREARRANSITMFLERALTSPSLFDKGPDVRVVDMLTEIAPKVGIDLVSAPEAQAVTDLIIGKSLLGLRSFDEAGRHLEAAWAFAEAHLKASDPLRIKVLATRASYFLTIGQNELAVQVGLDGERMALEHLGPMSETTLLVQGVLAEATLWCGRFEEAERRYDEVIPRLVAHYGPEHGEVIAYRGGRAMVWRAQGRREEARVEHEKVFALAQRVFSPHHFRTLNAGCNLAITLLEMGAAAEAEKLSRDLTETAGSLLPELLWFPYHIAGEAALQQGRTEEAIKLLQQGIDANPDKNESQQMQVATSRILLAKAYIQLDDSFAAERELRAVTEHADPTSVLAVQANAIMSKLSPARR